MGCSLLSCACWPVRRARMRARCH